MRETSRGTVVTRASDCVMNGVDAPDLMNDLPEKKKGKKFLDELRRGGVEGWIDSH